MIEKIKKATPILVILFTISFILGCVEKPAEEEIKPAAKFQPPKIPPKEPIPEKVPAAPSMMDKIFSIVEKIYSPLQRCLGTICKFDISNCLSCSCCAGHFFGFSLLRNSSKVVALDSFLLKN
jgi:hypothetical protein